MNPGNLLKKYIIEPAAGCNELDIPIAEMNTGGVKQVLEICLVAWKNYMLEADGMFAIEDIQVK